MTQPNPPAPLSRREAFKHTLVGGLMLGGLQCFQAGEASPVGNLSEAASFVPENDYPYFGFEPEGSSSVA